MLALGVSIPGLALQTRRGFAAAFSAILAHDAPAGPLGNVQITGNAGPVSLVGGPLSGAPGTAGGLFDVSGAGGIVSVAFDRAGLGDGLAEGQSVLTELAVTLDDTTQTTAAVLRVQIARAYTAPVLVSSIPDQTDIAA